MTPSQSVKRAWKRAGKPGSLKQFAIEQAMANGNAQANMWLEGKYRKAAS